MLLPPVSSNDRADFATPRLGTRAPVDELFAAIASAPRAMRDPLLRALLAPEGMALEGEPPNTKLSATGMLLARLTSGESVSPPAAAALGDIEGDATQLGDALRTSISKSGAFYESHLARWAAGTLPIEELFEEPQARMAAAQGSTDSDNAAQTLAREAIREDLAPIVRRQLAMLEHPSIVWRGDIWPGQSAQIEIQPDDLPREENGESSVQATGYHARIQLTLPALGGIDAAIALRSNTVSLSIESQEEGVPAALRDARPSLADALHAQGLNLGAFAVKHHGHDKS